MSFFGLSTFFLSRPRVISRALGAVALSKPAQTPRARLGPGRGLGHVLWGVKVAILLGEGFRARRAIHAPVKPQTGKQNVRRLM